VEALSPEEVPARLASSATAARPAWAVAVSEAVAAAVSEEVVAVAAGAAAVADGDRTRNTDEIKEHKEH
jgi:hypothetical protein